MPFWAYGGQPFVLGSHAEELIAGIHQGIMTQTAPIQQLKVHPPGITQFDNRRRWKGEYHGFAGFPRMLSWRDR